MKILLLALLLACNGGPGGPQCHHITAGAELDIYRRVTPKEVELMRGFGWSVEPVAEELCDE